MGRGVASGQNRRIVPAGFANFDGVAGLHMERRNIHFLPVHQQVAVADQLAGLGAAGAESHAVDHVIKATLQRAQKVFAGDAFLLRRSFEDVAELAFEELIVTPRLLFFAELESIAYQFRLAILTVLAGSEVALFNGALFGVATLPF